MASAESGGSGGGLEVGNGTATNVSDDSLNDENVGLRISLVTYKDNKTQVVKNRWNDYYLDVWCDNYTPNYNNVNSTSRYSPIASRDNIKKTSASSFDNALNEWFIENGGTLKSYTVQSENNKGLSTVTVPISFTQFLRHFLVITGCLQSTTDFLLTVEIFITGL